MFKLTEIPLKTSVFRLKKYQSLLLFVLPVLYLAAGLNFRFLLGNLSLRSVDPDYVYFISGLSISEGYFKVGHIDHPGTPLQLLIALVFRIVFLFAGKSESFVEDVFSRPDFYMSITSIFIIILTSLLLFFAGKYVLKTTKSVLYVLLIQTAPFLPQIWYDIIGRITPELMMPFPVLFLSVLVIHFWFEKEPVNSKMIWGLALISAFGLAVKLTYLPLILLPLFYIEPWKKRLKFLAATGLFFLIIALPATLQFSRFFGWVKNIFVHSGSYGNGEANIIDFAAFKNNLNELFYAEKTFFYILAVVVILLVVYLVVFRKKADSKIVLVTTGLITTIAVEIILVGKHYAHRNFIPALLLSPLLVFVATGILQKLYPKKITKWIVSLGIIGLLVLNIQHNKHWLPIKNEVLGSDIEKRSSTWHFASMLEKDSYKIIASQDYGCPFIEYTLMYSMAWAPNHKKAEYTSVLGKLYPNTYNYFTWDNTLRYWADKFDAQKIIESGKPVYLYLERNEDELYEKTISKLKEINSNDFTVEREKLYFNPETNEIIFKLNFSLVESPKVSE